MTRVTPLVLALAISAFAAPQQVRDNQPAAQPPSVPIGTASILGVVTDDQGRPQRRARVTVLSVDRTVGQTATTDDAGIFGVKNLPAGRYNVQATKRAWLDTNYGATRPGRQGTTLALADGQQVTGVRIAMTRGAVIAGTVRGESGEPARNLSVNLMQFSTRSGTRSLGQAGSTLTDDLGGYRFWGLSPGDFIVMVSGLSGAGMGSPVTVEIRQTMPGDVARATQTSGPSVSYAPVFFPGTTDASMAETLHVAAAEERTDVDLLFRLRPTSKIEGAILPPPGVTIADYQLRMFPMGDEFVGLGTLAFTALPDENGQFVIPSVAPGRYTLQAAGGAAPPAAGGPNAPRRQLAGFATADVVVVDQDVVKVSLNLQPPASVKARMVFEGADPPKDLNGFQVSISNPVERGQILIAVPAFPATPLVVAFPPLPPGKYPVFYSTPRGSPWVAVSAMTGGRDAFDAPLDVRGDIDDLVVTFTDHPSEIAGRLEDPSGRPATDFFVIVFPADRALWTPSSRRIQSVRPASDGGFSLKGLPAGNYLIGALTDVEPGEWFQASFLEEIARGAQRIAVAAGQRTTITLKLAGGTR